MLSPHMFRAIANFTAEDRTGMRARHDLRKRAGTRLRRSWDPHGLRKVLETTPLYGAQPLALLATALDHGLNGVLRPLPGEVRLLQCLAARKRESRGVSGRALVRAMWF